jgi:hypothetical protein
MWRLLGLQYNLHYDNDPSTSWTKTGTSASITISHPYVYCNHMYTYFPSNTFSVDLENRLSNDGSATEETPDINTDFMLSFSDDNDLKFNRTRQNIDDQNTMHTNDAFTTQQWLTDFLAQDGNNSSGKETTSGSSLGSSVIDMETPSSMSMPMMGFTPIDCISDMMRSDMYVLPRSRSKTMTDRYVNHRDHLYFDRVHSFFPILSRRHYFSRTRRPRTSTEIDAFQCLQYAMWTLAVSTSSQFQYIQDDLYAHTRRMLDILEMDLLQADFVHVEQVQAWALLSIYDFMRMGYRRGWVSAGKCLRFAVLMKLHNVDGRDGLVATSAQNLSFAEAEERRRTFWMAYTIDRTISLLDTLPLTFDQHTVSTTPSSTNNKMLTSFPTVSNPPPLPRRKLPSGPPNHNGLPLRHTLLPHRRPLHLHRLNPHHNPLRRSPHTHAPRRRRARPQLALARLLDPPATPRLETHTEPRGPLPTRSLRPSLPKPNVALHRAGCARRGAYAL